MTQNKEVNLPNGNHVAVQAVNSDTAAANGTDLRKFDKYMNGNVDHDVEHGDDNGKTECRRCLTGTLSFAILMGFGTMSTMTLNMYLTSQITTIEKVFGLSSLRSGALLSANDIGFLITVLFAAHVLHRYHIPRILGSCTLIAGLAGLVLSLPHFILGTTMPEFRGGQNNITNSTSLHSHLCLPNSTSHPNGTHCQQKQGQSSGGDHSWILILIGASLVVIGMVKSPRMPLSITYLDNSSPRDKIGFYLGIAQSLGIFGPFLALTLGGLFSAIPVDLKETKLTPDDPRWVGAWWIGFLLFGTYAVVMALPLFSFPRERTTPSEKHKSNTEKQDVRSVKEKQRASVQELKSEKDTAEPVIQKRLSDEPFFSMLKDLPISAVRIFSKPVYTLAVFSNCAALFAIMAYASFGPKYIENQFQMPTWKANLVLGVEKLFTTAVGTFLGGLVTRRLKLDLIGCLKMKAITRGIGAALTILNYFFGCDNQHIYGFENTSFGSTYNSSMHCACSNSQYLPVCTDDDKLFFSPCHAGCELETDGGYMQCAASSTGKVTTGLCATDCPYLIPFVGVNALHSLIGTMALAPTFVIFLRAVTERDRSLAIGFNSCMLALLVFLPAPIAYGKLFDTVCLLWKTGCSDAGGQGGRNGACSLYDLFSLRVRMVSVDLGLRILSFVLSIIAVIFALRQAKQHPDKEKQATNMEIKINFNTKL